MAEQKGVLIKHRDVDFATYLQGIPGLAQNTILVFALHDHVQRVVNRHRIGLAVGGL